MTHAATRGLRWEASSTRGDQCRWSGLDYGRGPGSLDDDHADTPADDDGRDAGTGIADSMATMFDRLHEAAAAHDSSELNDIATLS